MTNFKTGIFAAAASASVGVLLQGCAGLPPVDLACVAYEVAANGVYCVFFELDSAKNYNPKNTAYGMQPASYDNTPGAANPYEDKLNQYAVRGLVNKEYKNKYPDMPQNPQDTDWYDERLTPLDTGYTETKSGAQTGTSIAFGQPFWRNLIWADWGKCGQAKCDTRAASPYIYKYYNGVDLDGTCLDQQVCEVLGEKWCPDGQDDC